MCLTIITLLLETEWPITNSDYIDMLVAQIAIPIANAEQSSNVNPKVLEYKVKLEGSRNLFTVASCDSPFFNMKVYTYLGRGF